MLRSEFVEQFGHEPEWIMLKKPNLIEQEDGTKLDFGPYNGWQTWNGELMHEKDADGNDTDEFAMVWIPYFGNNEEEGKPKELFNKFYRAKLSDGSTAEYGGYISSLNIVPLEDYVAVPTEKTIKNEETGEDEIIIEDVTELKKIGEVLVDFDFDENSYNRYQETLPNPVPGIVESKLMEADSKTNEILATGTTPTSVNLATSFLNLDGSEITEPIVYKYDDAFQAEILKAFMACRSGLKSYTINLPGYRTQGAIPAEGVYRLYVELETWKKMNEMYNEVWKSYVSSFANADKDQKTAVNRLTYGETELPKEYQDMLEKKQADVMTEMQELAEALGIND